MDYKLKLETSLKLGKLDVLFKRFFVKSYLIFPYICMFNKQFAHIVASILILVSVNVFAQVPEELKSTKFSDASSTPSPACLCAAPTGEVFVGVDMFVGVDKGEKVKVKSITINGNNRLSDSKVRGAMKNTKKKMLLRFYKRSKYVEEDYQEDLKNIIDLYKENGYRDARILSDSLIVHDKKNISLVINLDEGEQYRYGKIDFVGNTVFGDETLGAILGIGSGDTYNGVELRQRIMDDSKPDALDLTNLYQNNGYMFSQINAVEVSAEGNTIDLEVRIIEGKPAYFNNVTITGNDVTNDRVIYREIRTRPGDLYSKANIIRTIRELGALGFFDPQQLTPNITNPNPVDGTLDIEYAVVEAGSSQIELQGGYGGGGFIGTLGLSFNNFSIKNIFNKEA